MGKPTRRANLIKKSNYTEEEFAPYTAALGAAALAWNAMHESLAALFWVLTGDDEGRLSLAVWNAINSDSGKRELLSASLETSGLARGPQSDIGWVLEKIRLFAKHRNRLTHAPLCRYIHRPGVHPSLALNNGLAIKLTKDLSGGVNIVDQYDWVRRWCLTMDQYLLSLAEAAGRDSRTPWPNRPELPRAPGLSRP